MISLVSIINIIKLIWKYKLLFLKWEGVDYLRKGEDAILLN